MLFTDPIFLFYFLPAFFAVYYLILRISRDTKPPAAAKLWLFLATLVFYGYREPWWAGLFFVSLVGDQMWAWLIDSATTRRFRRAFLTASIAQNFGLFFTFKYVPSLSPMFYRYTPLFADAIPQVFQNGSFPLLPAGLSFYLLESMSYVIDVYRREVVPSRRSLDFFSFVGAFPRLVAGPIARYGEIQGGFARPAASDVDRALRTFALGLFLKVGFADSFSVFTPYAFGRGTSLDFLSAWIGLSAYAFQLYFDFAGYSFMAIALGTLLGFTYPENFRRPYAATSISDFWRRWHITLGRWVRDYLYFPLAAKWRRRPWGNAAAVLITMTLLGAWHGPSFNFLLMGLWWGIWIVIEDRWNLDRFRGAGARTRTILIVWLGWLLFRARDLAEAREVAISLFTPGRNFSRFTMEGILTNPLAAGLCLIGLWYAVARDGRSASEFWSESVRNLAAFGLFLVAILLSLGEKQIPFLYFHF